MSDGNPLGLQPKAIVQANYAACVAYDDYLAGSPRGISESEPDPQAMAAALDAAFEVVYNEISYRWLGKR